MPPIPGSSTASRSRHYYKFRMFNRSYEGYYTYGEFMENCMIVNRNQFPFLPKSLLVARCKTTWDNLLKSSQKEQKSPPSKSKKKHSSTTSVSSSGSSQVDKPDEEVFKKPLIPKKSSLSKSASQRSILDFDSGDENEDDVSPGSSSNSSWNHPSPTYKSTPFKVSNFRTDLNNNNNDDDNSQSSTSSCSNRSKSRNLIENEQDHFDIVNSLSSRSSSQQSSNSSSSSTNSSSKSSKRNMNDRQSNSISLSSSSASTSTSASSSRSSVRCKSSTSKTFVGLFDEPDEIDTRNLIQISQSDSSSNSSNTSPKKRKTLFSKPLAPADLSNPPILTTTIEEADPLSTISLDSLSNDLSQQRWSIPSQLASGSSHHTLNSQSQSLRSNIDLSSAILNQYGKSSICSEPIELEFGDFSDSTTSDSSRRRSSSSSSQSQSEDQPQDTSQQIMIRHIDSSSSSSSNSSNQSG